MTQITLGEVYRRYARTPYEDHIKTPLEAISLVAACVFFFVYICESDDRKDAARLQRLQVAELCNSLASKIKGNDALNYEEPRSFDEWDVSNSALDSRIAWLDEQCAAQQTYVAPTRLRRPTSSPAQE